MKGYSEHRGHSSKLDFDHATGQFIDRPIASAFASQSEPNLIVQKLVKIRQSQKSKKAKQQTAKVLARIGPAMREDVGLTEFYAAASQS